MFQWPPKPLQSTYYGQKVTMFRLKQKEAELEGDLRIANKEMQMLREEVGSGK